MIIVLMVGYLLCGFLAWGVALGYFTKRFPYMRNIDGAWMPALLGPIGLVIALSFALAFSRAVSFRVRPLTKEERWQEFKKEHGLYLDRDYFERNHG